MIGNSQLMWAVLGWTSSINLWGHFCIVGLWVAASSCRRGIARFTSLEGHDRNIFTFSHFCSFFHHLPNFSHFLPQLVPPGGWLHPGRPWLMMLVLSCKWCKRISSHNSAFKVNIFAIILEPTNIQGYFLFLNSSFARWLGPLLTDPWPQIHIWCTDPVWSGMPCEL